MKKSLTVGPPPNLQSFLECNSLLRTPRPAGSSPCCELALPLEEVSPCVRLGSENDQREWLGFLYWNRKKENDQLRGRCDGGFLVRISLLESGERERSVLIVRIFQGMVHRENQKKKKRWSFFWIFRWRWRGIEIVCWSLKMEIIGKVRFQIERKREIL